MFAVSFPLTVAPLNWHHSQVEVVRSRVQLRNTELELACERLDDALTQAETERDNMRVAARAAQAATEAAQAARAEALAAREAAEARAATLEAELAERSVASHRRFAFM